jgi:RNA polymerase sigma-70 factor (ECF subfamily)
MASVPLTLVESAGGRSLAERPDDELMLLAASGQTTAFGALVSRHAARLRGFCAKLVGNTALGEELAQETWLAIWNARNRYSADGKFTVFLYVAARNRCRNLSRDQKRRAGTADPVAAETVADTSADQMDALLVEERRRRVIGALAKIPEKYRDALVLRYSEGLDYPDIARIVGRSEAGVRSRVHLGLQHLKKRLERSGDVAA